LFNFNRTENWGYINSEDLEIKIQKKEPIEKPKEEQEALTKVADVVAKLQEKNDLLSIKIKKKQVNKAIDRVAHLVSDLEEKNQLLSVKIQVKKDAHIAELKEAEKVQAKQKTNKKPQIKKSKQKPQQAKKPKKKQPIQQATIKKLQEQAEQPSRALSNVAALVEDLEKKNKKLSRKVKRSEKWHHSSHSLA